VVVAERVRLAQAYPAVFMAEVAVQVCAHQLQEVLFFTLVVEVLLTIETCLVFSPEKAALVAVQMVELASLALPQAQLAILAAVVGALALITQLVGEPPMLEVMVAQV